MTTASPPATKNARQTAGPARRGRAPWTLHLAAVPLTLMSAVTCFGAVYFGTHDDATRPASAPAPGSWQAWLLIVVLLAYAVTALVSVPGIYRRSATAWRVTLGVIAAQLLFGALKFLGLGEDAALVFVVADVVVAAGLLAPPTRRHLGLL